MTTLVADVGGTNTRVAVCMQDDMRPVEVARYRNAEFANLGAVLTRYMEDHATAPLSHACVAIAGPVRAGLGRMTNLAWTVSPDLLCTWTGARQGFVINDLEAQGHALDWVGTRRLHGPGTTEDPAAMTRLVVGMGTGFNAAPVHPVQGASKSHVVPSECGHAGLPVWDDETLLLSKWLVAQHGFASIEECLSGRGLASLHRFLETRAGPARPDAAAVIAALESDPAPRDVATAALFAALLGRTLGDLALTHLPWGGLYLIGGLARATAPHLSDNGLAAHFCAKGRFSEFLEDFSVFVVEDDYAALVGCASYSARHI